MKFSTAWAVTAAQNVSLKAATLVLGIVTLTLAATCIKLALKSPLIVERGCAANIAKLASNQERTASEIESFTRVALSQRFNSDEKIVPTFLSSEEESARFAEQKELNQREMTQKVIFNKIQITGEKVVIHADRLISIGNIRSAFLFPLQVTISSILRTEVNPYGLTLSKVSPLKAEESR